VRCLPLFSLHSEASDTGIEVCERLESSLAVTLVFAMIELVRPSELHGSRPTNMASTFGSFSDAVPSGGFFVSPQGAILELQDKVHLGTLGIHMRSHRLKDKSSRKESL
jgi:hypothetical protein